MTMWFEKRNVSHNKELATTDRAKLSTLARIMRLCSVPLSLGPTKAWML